jgi:hypothetical protein
VTPESWTRWLTLPERRPGTIIGAVGLIFVLAYTSSLVLLPKPTGRIVLGDAVHYYVYLRSAVFDRDLQFRNEYVQIYGLRGGEADTEWIYAPTATGHTRNLMSVGPAIVWSPLFLAVTAAVALGNAAGLNYPLDGFGRLFQASAGVSGAAAAAAGAWLSFLLAERLFGRRAAVWATLGMWLGSPAIYYSLISPTYSHASSMLVTSAFLCAWVATLGRDTPRRYAMVGALGGLTALVRWQDSVFLVAPLAEAIWSAVQSREGPAGRFIRPVRNLLACGGAALAAFSPQLLIWYTLYGTFFLVPQGGDFMRWGSPDLMNVLFSDMHGLISWTPVVALAIAGLVLLPASHRVVGIAAIAIFVLSWYANAAVADWWAGEAYGSRRFVSCFPIFTLGLAALLDRFGAHLRLVVILTSAIVLSNLLLLVQYEAFMKGLRDIAPYPRGFYGLWLARFIVPVDLARWLWHAIG